MKPLVYISGPFALPDPIENTRRAIAVGELVERELDVAVFIPHLTVAWHLVSPAPSERWIERDLEVLARCSALVRIPGESKGADIEVAFADSHAIRVFPMHFDDELPRDAYRWAGREPR